MKNNSIEEDVDLKVAGLTAFNNALLNKYNILDEVIAETMRKKYLYWVDIYIEYRHRILHEFEWNKTERLDKCPHIPNKIKDLITKEVCFTAKENLMASEYRLMLEITKSKNVWYCNSERAFNIHFGTLHDMMVNYYCFFDPSIIHELLTESLDKNLGI